MGGGVGVGDVHVLQSKRLHQAFRLVKDAHTDPHTHMHTHMLARVHAPACTCTHDMHAHTHTCSHMCMHLHAPARMTRMRTHTYTHTCSHMRMHLHAPARMTRTHTPAHTLLLRVCTLVTMQEPACTHVPGSRGGAMARPRAELHQQQQQ
jgi:hypothetical protein